MTFQELANIVIETVDHFMRAQGVIRDGYYRPYLLIAWSREKTLQIVGGPVGYGEEDYLNRNRAMELISPLINGYEIPDSKNRTARSDHSKGSFIVTLGIYDIGDTRAYMDMATEILMAHLEELN